jgi:hypothetical protein
MFMVYDADMILYSNRFGAQLISVMDSTFPPENVSNVFFVVESVSIPCYH